MQMNWKRVTLLSQAFMFCSLWFSGLSFAQTPVTSQTPPANTPADQMMKAKKRVKSNVDTMTAAPTTAPTSVPQTVPGASHRMGTAQRTMEDTEKKAAAKTASESEIQAAKASGKVWVNTDSGIYHKSGRWYGATKQGKFMTEQEAKGAGYKPARNEK
jgi:hypothetical protein